MNMQNNLERFKELALKEGFYINPMNDEFLKSEDCDLARIKNFIKWVEKFQPPKAKSAELQGCIDIILALKDDGVDNVEPAIIQPALKLLEFISSLGVQLFKDQYGEHYVAPEGNGSYIIKLESREFKNWLLGELCNKKERIPGKDIIETAKSILAAQIQNDAPIINLLVRTAKDNKGNYYYDLGDKTTVKINKEGWEILDKPPILFYRFKHQAPQVSPAKGGDIFELLKLINVKDEDEAKLLIIYIISCFLNGFPKPVLVVHGQHGSAKSTLFKLLKSLIDPSSLGLIPPIKNDNEFIQIVAHHWFCPFDNLSSLKANLSDHICRACTGGGFSKRTLYSDNDDFIYTFQHIIAINGINNVVVNPDLLDRSILIELARIKEDQRKTDSQIEKEFNEIKSQLLGACFDIISQAIAIEPEIKTGKLYRMADFTRWGYAIAETIGIGGEKFLEIYDQNIVKQNKEALEASIIGPILIKLLDKNFGELEFEPSLILKSLNAIAAEDGLNIGMVDFWPTDARWLSRRLKQISPNMEKIGIKIEFGRSDGRYIKIYRFQNEK